MDTDAVAGRSKQAGHARPAVVLNEREHRGRLVIVVHAVAYKIGKRGRTGQGDAGGETR